MTGRDKQIIEYVKEKGEADMSEIHEKFFPGITGQFARERMRILVNRGHLKRRKDPDNRFYIYYKE